MSSTTPLKRDEPQSTAAPVRLMRGAVAIVFLLLLAAGLVTTLRAAFGHKLDLFPKPVTWHAFLKGETTADIASSLSAAPLPVQAAHVQRGLGWDVLGDLGPRVRQGCPGWLFLADELRVHPHGAADMVARADVLAQVRDGLRERGIGLLVVTVPDKSRLEAAHLCGLARAPAMEGRLHDWSGLLAQRGIDSLDLTAVLEAAQQQAAQPVFLRTDTHWNELGASAGADAVGAAVLQHLQPAPAQQYRVTREPAKAWPGDLVHLAGLQGWSPLRPLPSEQVAAAKVEAAADAGGGDAPDADDLFGDVQAPNVALIGTSYSNTSNFGPFLERRLQAQVGRFAKDGGDFAGAAHDYFTGAEFRDHPPQLLIWEIPERVLQMPRNGETIGWPVE